MLVFRPAKIFLVGFIVMSIAGTWWLSSVDFSGGIEWFYKLTQNSETLSLALFAVLATVSQVLVVPSGFLLLLIGGFVLGAWKATLVYAVIQVLTLFPLTWLAKNNRLPLKVTRMAERHLSRYSLAKKLSEMPFLIGIILRLTPVIPSAVACLLSVWLKVSFGIFLLATVTVCWVRPLILSSIGERLPDMGQLLKLAI